MVASASARYFAIGVMWAALVALGVPLRIEENLHVHDVVALRPQQIRPGKVVEVAGRKEHARSRIVEIEKRLQIVELVGRTQRLDDCHGRGRNTCRMRSTSTVVSGQEK